MYRPFKLELIDIIISTQNQQGHQQTRTAEADHAFSLPFKTVCHNKPRERQREFNPSSCY
ncbi:uncharacterized protein LOC119652236 isoform X3 [Hermetia illucens]|uniref:uncharacterized protein LOC119652236 isoform X3 n=1 Tax=Hermetia illucens TaxID=343691 RepID=UPI0018CBF1FC|nr:uncharacterized protein LOC119652236 isoform X3 [Hermetia illucens]